MKSTNTGNIGHGGWCWRLGIGRKGVTMFKSYSQFMKEITPERLYHGLLAHGLFTEKLPPIFTSVNFFDYCQNRKQNFHDKWSNYIYYESIRDTNIPRQLGIPNPMAYQQLCKCLSDNWYEICDHFERYTSCQTHKVSRIHIRKLTNNPALFEMNYNNWKIDGSPEPDLIMGKRYLVKVDIANFFPSIYTHSLPWALIGKSQAKIDRNKDAWYNKIDHYAQYLKNGETHGLIIGPHASNLLSEIILAVVDYNLHVKKWFNFIHHVDDYTCYVETYEKGQEFIIDLSEELHAFDLRLNEKKTSIEELPLASIEQWVRQINAIKTKSNDETMKFPDVRAYLDNVIEIKIHQNNDKSSILKYAIKVLSGQKMTHNAKDYYVKTILHYAILYPYLVPIIDEYIFKKIKPNPSLINIFTNQIYHEGIRSRNYEEVSFSLFFAIKYNFNIENININELLKTNNCIVYLLSFLYYKKQKNKEAIKKIKTLALKLSLNEDDFNQYWVFIYEVLSKSSLTGDWKDMKSKNVTFLKTI